MVLMNFLDEKVLFLQVAIVFTCFQPETSQNKLDTTLLVETLNKTCYD